MAFIKSKQKNFERAYESLTWSMKMLSRYTDDEDMYLPMVASVIKNFELTYETCWKFLRHYLFEKEGIEANSPRMVFRVCSERGILPQDLVEELMLLIDVRNQTVHTYDQEIAERVIADIMRHVQAFAQIVALIV